MNYQGRRRHKSEQSTDPYGDDWKTPKVYVGDVVAFATKELFSKQKTKSKRGTVTDLSFVQQPGGDDVKRSVQILEHGKRKNAFIVPVNVHEILDDLIIHVVEPNARTKEELVLSLSTATFWTEDGVDVSLYHRVYLEDKLLYRNMFRGLVCIKANGNFPMEKTLKRHQARAIAAEAEATCSSNARNADDDAVCTKKLKADVAE